MDIYMDFLNKYDYDVRKTKDARWIDQKCTCDVLWIIADCILEYIDNNPNCEFTVSDIWHSNYARENVIQFFSKPDPKSEATNEYDKYFGQPIKLFSYSKLLNTRKKGNTNYYSINNREILEKIALRPTNALEFLCKYIIKVLEDSELLDIFNNFFEVQTKEVYKNVRDKFIEFTINNTNINGETECGRIFTKVINPLAFKFKKLGTVKGKISKHIITLNDIQYNRLNWRDNLSGKEKNITRADHESKLEANSLKEVAITNYMIMKAKKAVRKFNNLFYEGKSEVKQINETVNTTQAHHIFSQSDYPNIADYIENLIMLTPNQHFSMAHPDNNTQYIDRDFQYICLISKFSKIYENLILNQDKSENQFYNFEDYKFVLNTGLNTEEFSKISLQNFANILDVIDKFYSDDIQNNKYNFLIKDNKVIF